MTLLRVMSAMVDLFFIRGPLEKGVEEVVSCRDYDLKGNKMYSNLYWVKQLFNAIFALKNHVTVRGGWRAY